MIRLIAVLAAFVFVVPAWAQHASADYQEDYHRQALSIFGDVIAMRTAAGHGQVPAMADYLAREFLEAGFPQEDVHVIPQVLGTGEKAASLVVSGGTSPVQIYWMRSP